MNQTVKIIALETSGRIGSIAIAENDTLIAQRCFDAPQTHSRQVLHVAADLAASAGWVPDSLSAVYVSAGPGSFNGLRVGITAAKTLAFALDIPVVAVPSTDVMALNGGGADRETYGPIEHLAVVMDAKRRQVFAAVFAADPGYVGLTPGWRPVLEAAVLAPQALLSEVPRPLHVLGEGLRWHADAFSGPGITCLPEAYWRPTAAHVCRLGRLRAAAGLYAHPDDLVPIYLRRPEAVELWEQRYGLAPGAS